MERFDLIVIGAGPAGYVGAIRAAQLGMKVAVVEKQFLGGTCLNIGCIPSKALLDATHEYYRAKNHFAARGITLGNVGFDLPAMMGFKDKVVRQLTGGVGMLLKKNGIVHLKGQARILAADKVQVADQGQAQEIEGSRILIATGSVPVPLPAAPVDQEHILDSTGALALARVPEKLLVIGAGAIGLELGCVWSRLGSDVLVVEFLDRVAPTFDREMSGLLQRALERQGLSFRLSTKVTAARVDGGKVQVALESGENKEQIVVDQVLVSVGRRPAIEELGLDQAGIALTSRGFIDVDKNYQTSVKNVYAVGDCIGGAMLAHKASDEAIACVERFAGIAGEVNYDLIPNIIYTAPELASVGLSEEQAREQARQIKIGKFPFTASGRARCMDETQGQVKLIADAATDRVLGVSILHARAAELIAEPTTAMEFSASAEDIARITHAHPTLSEAIREAALGADQRVIHL